MRTGLIIISFLTILQSVFAQKESSIVESNNKFTFDIYQKLRKNNENFILSPVSITSAIAMTYIGAKNNTFDEISNTFYFEKTKNKLCKDYNNLLKLNKKINKNVSFYNSNSIWIQKNLEIDKVFLKLNKQYFSSSLHLTDFLNKPNNSRLEINKWVETKTKNKIKELIQVNTIDNSTRLVLVNALYFKAAWQNKFDKNKNTIENFQIGNRKYTKTNFMNRNISSWYFEDKYIQIVEIPYSGEDISLLIILPKSYRKFKKVEKKLIYEFYVNYMENKQTKRIKISLPKFKIDTEFNLNSTLFELGVKDAFTRAADFSGITNKENLFISNVVHKANIFVDEEGTEATAATAVMIGKTSFMREEVQISINKPFIYILKNNHNNCIYFIGKIENPN